MGRVSGVGEQNGGCRTHHSLSAWTGVRGVGGAEQLNELTSKASCRSSLITFIGSWNERCW
jgi:hypothetical protein